MKKAILFAFILISLIPIKASATAGFAEYAYVMDYNDHADIWWGANSDICSGVVGKSKNCFILWSKDPEKQTTVFYDTELLQKISIPESRDVGFAFGQSFVDETWLIMDLKARVGLDRPKEIFRSDNYTEALKFWKSRGLNEPKFSTQDDLRKNFKQISCEGLFC